MYEKELLYYELQCVCGKKKNFSLTHLIYQIYNIGRECNKYLVISFVFIIIVFSISLCFSSRTQTHKNIILCSHHHW